MNTKTESLLQSLDKLDNEQEVQGVVDKMLAKLASIKNARIENQKTELVLVMRQAAAIYEAIPESDRGTLWGSLTYDDNDKVTRNVLFGMDLMGSNGKKLGKTTRKTGQSGQHKTVKISPELEEKILKFLPTKDAVNDYKMTKKIAEAVGKNPAGFGDYMWTLKDAGKVDTKEKGTSDLWWKL